MPAAANGAPMVPTVSITAPTPPRTTHATATTTPARSHAAIAPGTPSGSSSWSFNRLLYRGALSLPDSYLLLDGLTFSARLESPVKHQLLENPLALALESMRGRQSLRFLGTIKPSDVWLDESGNVEMDIHPRATLSKIYFENIFCLSPFPPASTSSRPVVNLPPGTRSEIGIKIALGDTDGPDTTYIVVFAQLTACGNHMVKFHVARMAPHAPPKPMPNRVPRPDDPIPRRPPGIYNRTASVGVGAKSARDLKRSASLSSASLALSLPSVEGGFLAKKQKLPNGTGRAGLGTGAGSADEVFKVPSLPVKAKKKGTHKGKEKEDVFGEASVTKKTSSGEDNRNVTEGEETEIERLNKNLIKKAALEHLCKVKDPTLQRPVDKSHPEFKEIWGWVYRGVGFALRMHMKRTPLQKHHVQRLIEAHTEMYVKGARDDLDISAGRT